MLGIVTVLFTAGYAVWMLYCYRGWMAAPEIQLPEDFIPSTTITVIVPARNEASNIRPCLQSILSQNYPAALFCVIVVDDHSEDDTASIAANRGADRVKVIRLADSDNPAALYKKKAIEMAVAETDTRLIVTTDADCIAGADWLRTIAGLYEKEHPKLIAAPVIFEPAHGIFEQFQALDFAGMMAITCATIHRGFYVMCNGANLAYEREAFLAAEGYKGVDKNPSGDDMMLLHKLAARHPGQIAFAKFPAAVVRTRPISTLGEFLQQRFRWTSKASGYQDKRVSAILGMVWLFNWLLLVGTIAAFSCPSFFFTILPLWVVKLAADYLVLRSAAHYFGQAGLLKTFWASQLLHIAYIVVVGTLGNLMPYQWKGRKINAR